MMKTTKTTTKTTKKVSKKELATIQARQKALHELTSRKLEKPTFDGFGMLTVTQAREIENTVKETSYQDNGKQLFEMGVAIAKSCTKTLVVKMNETNTSKSQLDRINGLYCGTRKNGKKLVYDFDKLEMEYIASRNELKKRPIKNAEKLADLSTQYTDNIIEIYNSIDNDGMDLIQDACCGLWEEETIKNGFSLCRKGIYSSGKEIPSDKMNNDFLMRDYFPTLSSEKKVHFKEIFTMLQEYLTPTEKKVLAYFWKYVIDRNISQDKVAKHLKITKSTFSGHLHNIRKKALKMLEEMEFDKIEL